MLVYSLKADRCESQPYFEDQCNGPAIGPRSAETTTWRGGPSSARVSFAERIKHRSRSAMALHSFRVLVGDDVASDAAASMATCVRQAVMTSPLRTRAIPVLGFCASMFW